MKKRWISALTLLVIAFVAVFSFGCAYVFEEEKFTVTFMSNGAIVLEEEYEAGEQVVFPEDPAPYSDDHYEYTFVGWNYNYGDPNSECVTELTVAHHDVTLYAAFKRDAIVNTGTFRVRFRDGITGELLKAEDVPNGGSATAPTPIDHTGSHMQFSHWSESFDIVTASMEVYAIYSGVPYPVEEHVLDEVRSIEVPYGERLNRHVLDLGSGDGIPLAFKFEGWFLDEEYTQRITAEDLMPAPEKAGEPLHVYAKFSIRSFTDTSNTATIDTSGALIYGGGDDYLYVRNLDDADGLIYTYEWNVTFNDKPFTGSEKQYDLFGAGEYAVSVNVTANYKNGVLVQSKQLSRAATVTKAVLSLNNIGIDRNTLVYGEGAPRATFDASGFQYEDGEELFNITYRYVLGGNTQDSAENNDDLKTVRLPVGRYALIAEIAELANYTVDCEDMDENGVADLEEISFSVTKKEVRLNLTVASNTYGEDEGFLPTLTFEDGFGLAYGEAFDSVTGGVLGAPEYVVAGRANSGKEYSGPMDYGYRIYAGESYTASVKGMNENGNYTVVLPAAVNFAIARRDFKVTVYVNDTSFIYGEIPQFTFATNALETDRADFGVRAWAYTLGEGSSTFYNADYLLDAGSYAVTVLADSFERLGDNAANYEAPTQENISVANFKIEKTALKIGIEEIKNYTYGDHGGNDPVPNATFEGFVKNPNGEYQKAEVLGGTFYWTYYAADSAVYSTTDPAIGKRVQGNYAVGTYTITPSGYTSENYEIEFFSTELTIAKASLKLTVGLSNLNDANALIYGTRPSLRISSGYTNGIFYEGFVQSNGMYETVEAVFADAVPTVTYFDAQNKVISANGVFHVGSFTADLLAETLAKAKATATNYEITVTPKAFSVTPKQLTITPIVTAGLIYGDTFMPDFVAEGFAYEDGRSVLDASGSVYSYQKGGASYTGNVHEGKTYFDAGDYTVNVAGFEAADYTFRYLSSTFRVGVRNATVNISATGATYGANPIVSYTAPNVLTWDMDGFAFAYEYQWYVNNGYRDYDSEAYTYFQAAEYRVTLNYEPNANYNLTVRGEGVAIYARFEITKAPLSIGVKNVNASYVYGTAPAPQFTYAGFVENENESVLNGGRFLYAVTSEANNTNANISRFTVGKYTVAASGFSANNYEIEHESATGFEITKKALTITVSVENFTYGESFVPMLSYEGFVYGENENTSDLVGSAIYTVNGNRYAPNAFFSAGAGEGYTVSVSGLISQNYEITFAEGRFNVAKAILTVTISGVIGFTYGEKNVPALMATVSGYVHGETDRTAGIVGTISYTYTGDTNGNEDNTANGRLRADTYTIGASGLSAANYEFDYVFENGINTFTVAPRAITITLFEGWNIYGGDPTAYAWYTLEGTIYDSELTFTPVILKGGESYEVASEHHFSIGTYTISVSYVANPDYKVGVGSVGTISGNTVTKTFTIAPRPIEVELTVRGSVNPGTYTYGQISAADYEPEWEVTGRYNIFAEDRVDNYFVAAVANANGYFGVGTHTVTLMIQVGENYAVTFNTPQFTVVPKSVTITLSQIANYTYGELEKTFAPIITVDGLLTAERDLQSTLLEAVLVSYSRNGGAYVPNTAFFDAGSYAATMGFAVDFNTQANGYENYNFTFKYVSATGSAENVSFNIAKAKFDINPTLPSMSPTKGANWAYAPEFGSGFFESNGFRFNGTIKLQSATPGTYTATSEATFNTFFEWEEGKFSITLNGLEVTDNFELTYRLSLLISSSNYKVTPHLINANGGMQDVDVGGDNVYSADFTYDGRTYAFTIEAYALKDDTVTDETDPSVFITVEYSTQREGGWSEEPFAFLSVNDSTTVYYRISTDNANYGEQIGSFQIDIARAQNAISTQNVVGTEFTYDSDAHTVDFTKATASFGAITYAEGGIAIENGKKAYTNAGTYTVTLFVAGTDDYDGATATVTVSVGKAALGNVKFNTPNVFTYNGAKQGYGISEVEGVKNSSIPANDFSITYQTGEEAYSEAIRQFMRAGTYTVRYNIAESENYFGTSGEFTIRIARATLNVTNPADMQKTYAATAYWSGLSDASFDNLQTGDTFAPTYLWKEAPYTGSGFTNVGTYQLTYTVKLYHGNEDVTDCYNITYGAANAANSANGAFKIQIDKAPLTVNKADVSGLTYDGHDQFSELLASEVSGRYNDGSTLSFTYSTSEAGSYGEPFEAKNANTYTVYYKVSAGSNYEEATGSYTITIAPKELTVTLPAAQSGTFGNTFEWQGAFAETGVEGEAISFVYSYTGNYMIGGASVDINGNDLSLENLKAIEDAGNYTFAFEYLINGNEDIGNYSITNADATFKITIGKAQGEITLPTLTTEFTYLGEEQKVDLSAVTKVGDGVLTYTVNGEQKAMATPFTFTTVADGNKTLTVNLSETRNYKGASEEIEITVNKAMPVLDSYTEETEYTYTAGNTSLIANNKNDEHIISIIKGLDAHENVYSDAQFTIIGIKYVTADGEEHAFDESNLNSALSEAGTYAVTVQVSGANYEEATTTFTFTINPAPLTVSKDNISGLTYNGSDQFSALTDSNVSGRYSDGSSFSFTYSTSAEGDYEGTFEAKNANTYTVYYKVSAGSNYEEATGSYTITIAKAQLTVSKDNISGLTYNGSDQFSALTDSNVIGRYNDGSTLSFTYSTSEAGSYGETFEAKNANTYTVYYKVSAGSNYEEATGSYTIAIAKAPLTVSKDNISGLTYNGSNQFSALALGNVTSTLYGNDSALLSFTYSTSAEGDFEGTFEAKNANTYTVYYKVSAGSNYEETTGSYTIAIAKAQLTVSKDNISGLTYNGSNQFSALTDSNVSGRYSDGSTLSFTYSTSLAGSYGETFEAKNANTYTVYYKVSAGSNYEEATGSYTIMINKANAPAPTNLPASIDGGFRYYGQTLESIAIKTLLGEYYSWVNVSEPIKGSDSSVYAFIYNPNPDNYNDYEGEITVITERTVITLTPSSAEIAVNYGSTAADAVEQFDYSLATEARALSETEQSYLTGKFNISISDGVDFSIGSTYLAIFNIELNDDYYEIADGAECDPAVLLKIRSVQIGVRDVSNNNAWNDPTEWGNEENWYTIEEALHAAQPTGDPNLETTIRIVGNISGTIETKFSELDSFITGYDDSSYYTIKNGVALLLPVVDINNTNQSGAARAYTTGTNGEYFSGFTASGSMSGLFGGSRTVPSRGNADTVPVNFNQATPLYSRLTVPSEVTLNIADGGTLTVGGITGAGVRVTLIGHLNRVSGSYSELKLEGNIESEGTINAYGNIVGNGSINAKAGIVRERFEVLDSPALANFVGRYFGNRKVSPSDLLGGNDIVVANPNEFPLENYQLVAISTMLNVHSGAQYLGNFRMFVEGISISASSMAIINAGAQFSIADFVITSKYEGDSDANGFVLLQDGAVLTKTVYESTDENNEELKYLRFKFEINGGAVGGIVSLGLSVFGTIIRVNSSELKFPISSTMDLVLKNGSYLFEHGYEFIGTTLIGFNNKDDESSDDDAGHTDPAINPNVRTATGAILTLADNANVTLRSPRANSSNGKGIIFYTGSKLTVGGGCALTIGGQLGGNIIGEKGAIINVESGLAQAIGYNGGTGNFVISPTDIISQLTGYKIPITFEGTETNSSAIGALKEGNQKEFGKGVTYYHNGEYWVSGDAQYSITYKYFYRDAEGRLQAIDSALIADESGNPTFVTPNSGVTYLSFGGITYPEYTFTGWYADEACTQTTNSINGLEMREYIIYGLFEKVPVYNFSYNTNYNTLNDNGSVNESGTNSGINMNKVPVTKELLDDFVSGSQINAQDNDVSMQRYFAGWYLYDGTTGKWMPYSAENVIAIYGELDALDIEVQLYAVWADKIHVIFEADTEASYNRYDAGFYRMGDTVSPLGYNNGNKDPEISTYFVDWRNENGEIRFVNSYTIPMGTADGTVITFIAHRQNKVYVEFIDETEKIEYAWEGYYMAGSLVAPSNYSNGNNDPTVTTYFVEWISDSGITITNSYEIPANTAGGTVITFTANRAAKITVNFTDSVKDPKKVYTGTGYYMPGSLVEAPGYISGNADPNISTYFIEWQHNGEPFDRIPENTPVGTTIELIASRESKIKVSVERQLVDANGKEVNKNVGKYLQLDIIATDPSGEEIAWIDDTDTTQTSSKTGYFISGTNLTISIKYWKDTGTLVESSCVNDSGWITIGNVKTAVKSEEKTNVEVTNELNIIFGAQYASSEGLGSLCLVEGTLVMLADGTQKKVEDLAMGDMLLAFNHLTGQYEASPMLINLHALDESMWCRVIYLTFSDGTRIGVITDHAFFDRDLNKYVYINEENAAEYIGHKFVQVQSEGGEFVSGEVVLTGVEVVEEFVRRFSPISGLINVVTGGLLSFTEVINEEGPIHGAINIFEFDENMKYDEEKMQADIEKYGLYTYEDFKDYMSYEEFISFPWAYFKVAVGKGNLTWEDILWNIQYIQEQLILQAKAE